MSLRRINESKGVLEYLDDLADEILYNLKKNPKYVYKGKIRGDEVDIRFNIINDKKFSGYTRINIFVPNGFVIGLDYELSKDTLVHELKHVDGILRRESNPNTHYYYNRIFKILLKYYKFLLYREHRKLLSDIIYYTNPDEFESYYNDMYTELKEIISDKMTSQEKRILINKYIRNKDIYITYNFINKNGFDVRDFFKKDEYCRFFLKKFYEKLDDSYKKGYIKVSKIKAIITWFNTITSFEMDDDKFIKIFNKKINDSVKKNYRKFDRLYTFFI